MRSLLSHFLGDARKEGETERVDGEEREREREREREKVNIWRGTQLSQLRDALGPRFSVASLADVVAPVRVGSGCILIEPSSVMSQP